MNTSLQINSSYEAALIRCICVFAMRGRALRRAPEFEKENARSAGGESGQERNALESNSISIVSQDASGEAISTETNT